MNISFSVSNTGAILDVSPSSTSNPWVIYKNKSNCHQLSLLIISRTEKAPYLHPGQGRAEQSSHSKWPAHLWSVIYTAARASLKISSPPQTKSIGLNRIQKPTIRTHSLVRVPVSKYSLKIPSTSQPQALTHYLPFSLPGISFPDISHGSAWCSVLLVSSCHISSSELLFLTAPRKATAQSHHFLALPSFLAALAIHSLVHSSLP